MKVRLLLFISLVTFLSCTRDKSTSQPIPEKKMIDIMVDVQISENYFLKNRNFDTDEIDSLLPQFYNAIFEKHQITKQQFDESINYYKNHLEEYKNLYDSVTKRLEIMKDKPDIQP